MIKFIDKSVVKVISKKMVIIIFALAVSLSRPTQSLQGYDCGHQHGSYKPYSAENVEACPALDDWDPVVKPVEAQVIRSSKQDTLEAYECQLRVTNIAEYCGRLESAAYGAPVELETKAFKLMDPADCKLLNEKNVMTFRYGDNKVEKFYTFGKGSFSRQIMTRGNRTNTGDCRAEDFTEGDRHFPHHTLRTIIEGKVIKKKIKFNRKYRLVTINEKEIEVDQQYSYQRSTIIWNSPEDSCKLGMHSLFEGYGSLYEGNKVYDHPSMVLVQNSEQTFGLQLGEVTNLCGSDVFKTNIQDLYVTVNETKQLNSGLYWYISKLQYQKAKVDELQNLKSMMTRNFITYSRVFSDAVKDIILEICETSRQISLNSLSLMRISENEGVRTAFGFGFNAIRRGSVFHIYPCRETEVSYRHLPNDTKDIPISFVDSQGFRRDGFLDTSTRHIKNSTIFYKSSSSSLPVTWDFQDGEYKCKTETGLIDCGAPKILPVFYDGVTEALKQKEDTLVFHGNLDDIPEEERLALEMKVTEFREDVEMDGIIRSKQYTFAREIFQKKYDSMFGTLGMPDFQNTVNEAVQNTNLISTMPTYIGMAGLTILTLFALCRLWSLYKDPKVEFWNLRNMFYVVIYPSKLYSEEETTLVSDNKTELDQIIVEMNRNGFNIRSNL